MPRTSINSFALLKRDYLIKTEETFRFLSFWSYTLNKDSQLFKRESEKGEPAAHRSFTGSSRSWARSTGRKAPDCVQSNGTVAEGS
jgi:hypothetical protein